MFPIPARDGKYVMGIPYLSPIDKGQNYRLTQLPQFKRLAHNKFYSQERKRFDKLDIKQYSNPIGSPKSKNIKSNFFKNNDILNTELSPKANDNKKHNSSILKVNKDSKNRKYFRYSNQQKPESKLRQNTDQAYIHHRESMQSKIKLSERIDEQEVLKPLQLLKSLNNLQPYEKQQIVAYNQIYYHGQNCAQKRPSLSQLNKKDGGYNWIKGDQIHFRYEILDCLGQGSFGQVFKCYDHKKQRQIALKIVKNNDKYTSQAKTQVKILNLIKSKDPTGIKNCVHIRDFFLFRERMCMTFDLMSINLYQLIKNNGYYGLPLDLIRRISLQILNALHFLHKNQIIHADLKPENILLKQTNKSGVKVIDFGSSCFQKQTIYTYIQSRYYRAPEVILGIPYNRKIDIWSFACVIAELHLGYPLFAGDEQHEQMCLFIEVFGYPPRQMLQISKRAQVFFDKNNHLKSHPKKAPQNSKSLSLALQNPKDKDFIDFLKLCFQWIPEKRCQALDCLKHEWILKGLPEQIRKQHLKVLNQQQQKKVGQGYQKNRSFSLNQPRNKLFH